MKKILPFILLVLTLASCSQDVKFNDKAVFQGVLNNNFWEGANAKAMVDGNTKMTIQAVSLTEVMKLEIPVPPTNINPRNPNTFMKYILGTSTNKTAFYSLTVNGLSAEYETGAGVGDGEVSVSEYDGITVSGTFRFNAKDTDPDSDEVVNVQYGTFYKVPVFKTI